MFGIILSFYALKSKFFRYYMAFMMLYTLSSAVQYIAGTH